MSLRRAWLAPLVLVSLFFAGLSGGIADAWAQQPPAPAATPTGPTNLTIMVVDVQSLLQNSKSAKMVRQQIEQKRNEYAK
jgi:Skp family chaperone for outer membrane proteins